MSNMHIFNGLGPVHNDERRVEAKLYFVEQYIVEFFGYCFGYGQTKKAPQQMKSFMDSVIAQPLKIA
jgi:hypothetical protein